MKKIEFMLLTLLISLSVSAQNVPFTKQAVKEVMKKVADWQIAHSLSDREHADLSWTQAALYVGMCDWAELAEKTDGDSSYYQWLQKIGKRNYWQVGQRMYHADDMAVGQAWLKMYAKFKNKAMLIPVRARTEWVMSHPSSGSMMLDYKHPESLERWSWCDALFMAPPVYAALYQITGNKDFIRFMNREYKATYGFLYDKTDSLFYRDGRYIGKKEANGKKIFWGRGNGWVVGGLAEILKILPKQDKNRPFYEDLFRKMCYRLAELQCSDGFWHASLLDPASYPSPETSCSGFVLYALAYGVHEGLLDSFKCMPVLIKGWNALLSVVEDNGKLGFVQPIGGDPQKVTRDMTEVYGVGAFLLAGNEFYGMAQ